MTSTPTNTEGVEQVLGVQEGRSRVDHHPAARYGAGLGAG
jgi:hypothetical protein